MEGFFINPFRNDVVFVQWLVPHEDGGSCDTRRWYASA